MIKIKLSDLYEKVESRAMTAKEAAEAAADRIAALGLPKLPSSWVCEAEGDFLAVVNESEVELADEHFEVVYRKLLCDQDIEVE